MNDSLAREILAKITNWTAERLTCERKDLQLLSDYKYDEYQQFTPGMRFTESLALWLGQFDGTQKRDIAYNFIKDNIIFISTSELNHLIRMAYPDFIKYYLIKHTAQKLNVDSYLVKKIINDKKFKVLSRECLFLGLSDGARIDLFRRFTKLRHEQVYHTYQITEEKANDLLAKLRRDVKDITQKTSHSKYNFVFLIDDFSASGISYLRQEGEKLEGKISKFCKQLDDNAVKRIFANDVKICVVLYVATKRAKKHIKETAQKISIPIDVIVIQELENSTSLSDDDLSDFSNLAKEKFDKSILTVHYKKGRHNKPHLGFDECGLSVVLSHNCPNNSLPIIWHKSEQQDIRALFPRQQRY